MAVNTLQMECTRCKVANTCPRKGSSPLLLGGKSKVFCHIVGGYGRESVDPKMLSAESKARVAKDGPCLTYANIPTVDPNTGKVMIELTKIFNHPVKHPRETIPWNINLIMPRSPGAPPPPKRGGT